MILATDEQMAARETWLSWLETTELPQGSFALKSRDGYCCLGGACLALNVPGRCVFGIYRFGHTDGASSTYVLPPQAQHMLGLSENPLVRLEGAGTVSAAELNDRWGKSFKEIAALLRPQLARSDYMGENPNG